MVASVTACSVEVDGDKDCTSLPKLQPAVCEVAHSRYESRARGDIPERLKILH